MTKTQREPGPSRGLDVAAAQGLAELVDTVADAVYVVDAEGRVAYANPAALSMLGYTAHPEELLGAASHATIHHSHPDGTPFPDADCPLLTPRTTGETVRVDDDHFICRDGRFVPVAYSSAPITRPEGRGAVVVFRDTTALRAAEAAARARDLRASRLRIVTAAQDERRRLGRDLHDGAQQNLTNVLLSLQLAAGQADAAARDALLAQAAEQTRAAIDQLRTLSAGLAPSVLINRGLTAGIESLTATAPLPVAVTGADPARRHDPAIESAAYFFVAEALTNVAKHAAATEASVTVDSGPAELTVVVSDNGKGGADPGRGSGLRGLADRLEALDGTLEIDSAPGAGTRLSARLPTAPAPR